MITLLVVGGLLQAVRMTYSIYGFARGGVWCSVSVLTNIFSPRFDKEHLGRAIPSQRYLKYTSGVQSTRCLD